MGAESVIPEIPDQGGTDSADRDAGVREPVGNRFVSVSMLHTDFGFAIKAFDLLNKSVDSGLSVWDITGRHKNYIAGAEEGDSTFSFRNIDTNSVHDKAPFEMNLQWPIPGLLIAYSIYWGYHTNEKVQPA